MTIKTFTFNPFQENTYLVWDETNEAVLIDAGMLFDNEKSTLKQFIEDNNLVLKRVLTPIYILIISLGINLYLKLMVYFPKPDRKTNFCFQQPIHKQRFSDSLIQKLRKLLENI